MNQIQFIPGEWLLVDHFSRVERCVLEVSGGMIRLNADLYVGSLHCEQWVSQVELSQRTLARLGQGRLRPWYLQWIGRYSKPVRPVFNPVKQLECQ
jgi:hypothetical protein